MSNEVQLLDADLNSLPTELPLLVGDTYELSITESEVKEPTEPGKAARWEVTLTNTQPTTSAPDSMGKTQILGPTEGRVFEGTQLAPTGRATMKMVAQNIAVIVQALRPRLTGNIQVNNVRDWHKQVIGKVVRVRVALEGPRDDAKTGRHYGPRNSVAEWYKS